MRKQFANGNIWFILAFLVMGLLFVSSSMTYAEQSQVSNIQEFLHNRPFENLLSQINFYYGNSQVSIEHLDYYKFVEFFLRKGAHFFSYFFLAIFWYMGLKNKFRGYYLLFAILSILAAAGFGGLDEAHQMFTPDRTPLFQDVLVNASGAFVGVFLAFVIGGIKRMKQR